MMRKCTLKDLAFARSGDKGDVCNIGLMAKSRNIYLFLQEKVTLEDVKKHFRNMVKGDVAIFPMDNVDSLQIVLRQSLGGGATSTLRFDQTGKSMGTALLRMQLEADESLLDEAMRVDDVIREKYGENNNDF